MSDISQPMKNAEKLPLSIQQKVVGLINIFLLIGLLIYLLDSAWSAIYINSKLTGTSFVVVEQILISIPIFVLFFYVFKNKIKKKKIKTIFFALICLIVSISIFFLISTMLFNTMLDMNFFGLPKLPKL